MSDDELLASFEDRTLPREQWTHRCHVKVAYLYLSRYSFAEAMNRIRHGIRAYNQAQGVVEGPASGYNETTTQAMTHLVAAVMRAYRETHPVTSADEFCDVHTEFGSKHILRFFYSPERRMDPRAKYEFVEPDLCDLPQIGDCEPDRAASPR